MTLPRFLDASYALLAEEHQRIDPLRGLSSVAELLDPADAPRERVPKKEEVTHQNEQSMAALNAMLSKLENAPVKKPRRAR